MIIIIILWEFYPDAWTNWLLIHLYPQLGQYLAERQHSITNITLILFSLQICKAMAYLEGLKMVHRFVNVCVCV